MLYTLSRLGGPGIERIFPETSLNGEIRWSLVSEADDLQVIQISSISIPRHIVPSILSFSLMTNSGMPATQKT